MSARQKVGNHLVDRGRNSLFMNESSSDPASKMDRRHMLTALGMTMGAASIASTQASLEQPQSSEGRAFRYCLNTSTIRGQKLGIEQESKSLEKRATTRWNLGLMVSTALSKQAGP